MVVCGAVLQGLKHLLRAFLVAPNQMRFKTFSYLSVGLVAPVVAKLDAAPAPKSIYGWKDADVVGKAVLLRVLDAVVESFLGGQVADAIRQGIPDHALLILNGSVLVDVVGADFGTRNGTSRPDAQAGGNHTFGTPVATKDDVIGVLVPVTHHGIPRRQNPARTHGIHHGVLIALFSERQILSQLLFRPTHEN